MEATIAALERGGHEVSTRTNAEDGTYEVVVSSGTIDVETIRVVANDQNFFAVYVDRNSHLVFCFT